MIEIEIWSGGIEYINIIKMGSTWFLSNVFRFIQSRKSYSWYEKYVEEMIENFSMDLNNYKIKTPAGYFLYETRKNDRN